MKDNGRPLIFESPEQLWDKAVEYFDWCDKNPLKQQVSHVKNGVQIIEVRRCYSLEGFCDYTGIVPQTFYNYKDRDGFLEICTRISNRIDNDWLTFGMGGIYNASIAAMKLGLKAKTETENTNKSKITIVTSEADALNKLLDEDS